MARAPKRRFTLVVVAAALLAAAVPAAGASAATLTIKAPGEIDHMQKFPVVTKGKAKANREYFVSVIYHNDDQGACGADVYEELAKQQWYVVHYQYPVTTDADGKYRLRSRRIFGGIQVTGKLCGYLMTSAGSTKATGVRSIAFI
jgi:hypothetical protein